MKTIAVLPVRAASIIAVCGIVASLSPAHAATILTGANCSATGLTTSGTATAQVIIGCAGAGTLQVNASGSGNGITTANANGAGSVSLVTGFSTGANSGNILVSGNGAANSATLNSFHGVQVGVSTGTGNVTVQNGGRLQVTTDTYGITIGHTNSTGSVTVDGANSVLTSKARISVGSFSNSTGSLTVSNGGLVQANGTGDNAMLIGSDAGSSPSSVLVTGSGSTLSTTGVAIGNGAGTSGGSLIVESGGTVNVGANGSGFDSGLSVGADGPSTIEVTGVGSSINVAAITSGLFAGNEINIGGFGEGSLIIDDSASVNASGANVHVSGGVFGSSTDHAGVLTVRNGGSITADTISIFANGTLNGDGTIYGNVVLDGGIIAPGNSPGTLTIDGDFTHLSGSLVFEIAGNGSGQFDVLNVLGDAYIDPTTTIDLVFTGGFAPTTNEVFEFLLASAFTSDMSAVAINILGLEDGFAYEAGFTDTGTFSLTALNDGVASVVPVPAAIWLFGSALGLLGWSRRKAA